MAASDKPLWNSYLFESYGKYSTVAVNVPFSYYDRATEAMSQFIMRVKTDYVNACN